METNIFHAKSLNSFISNEILGTRNKFPYLVIHNLCRLGLLYIFLWRHTQGFSRTEQWQPASSAKRGGRWEEYEAPKNQMIGMYRRNASTSRRDSKSKSKSKSKGKSKRMSESGGRRQERRFHVSRELTETRRKRTVEQP